MPGLVESSSLESKRRACRLRVSEIAVHSPKYYPKYRYWLQNNIQRTSSTYLAFFGGSVEGVVDGTCGYIQTLVLQ